MEKDPIFIKIRNVLEEETRKRFIREVIERGEIKFVTLFNEILQISETNARHHLKLLIEESIIIREKEKGSKAIVLKVNPKYILRLNYYFDIKKPKELLCIVGQDKPGSQLQSYEKRFSVRNPNLEKITVLTTSENKELLIKSKEWNNFKEKYHTEILITDLQDFDKNLTEINQYIENTVKKYLPLADITGGSKVQSLSLYINSKEYGIQTYYSPRYETENLQILP